MQDQEHKYKAQNEAQKTEPNGSSEVKLLVSRTVTWLGTSHSKLRWPK